MSWATLRKHASLRVTWLVVASLPLSGGWRLSGPFGGSARSLAIDPQNRSLLLAGARDSLLVRSDDGGSSWRLLSFPAGAPGTFQALIIDPKQPGHFYAGLDAGDTPASGVYESRDGGEHWQSLEGLRGFRIESLVAWPGDPHVLAAGTSKGAFLTRNAGETWRRISGESDREMQDITALAFDPADANTIYAGTPHLPWKTVDSGNTWRSIHTGLIDDSDIFSIRVDASRPQLVFASACSGIYRSDNAGASWTKLQGIPGTHRRTHIIAVDPRNRDVIFAGTTLGLFRSPDGGRTWRQMNGEQVNWMVFDPADPQILYLATEYAGLLKSLDSGATFQPTNRGFSNHSLTQITGAGKKLFASSAYEGRYGGVFTSEDGGLSWKLRANQEKLLGRNLIGLVAAPARSGLLFAVAGDGLLKSANGGATWLPLPIQFAGSAPRRIGRIQALQGVQSADKLTMFLGTDTGLYHSANGGASWERVPGAGIAGVAIRAIYGPPRGGSRIAVRTDGGLFLSEDGGRAWRLAATPGPSYYIYDLAIPVDKDVPLLAATSRGVLQSSDSGAHWKLITEGIPEATVNTIRFHPDRKLEAFLVQYGKIYRSQDGGSSWQPFPSDGLESSAVRALWFTPETPGRIIALSAARGTLIFDIPQPDVARQADQQTGSSKEDKEER